MRLFASIGVILLAVVLQSHCQQEPDLTIGATQQNLDMVSRSVTNLAQKISLAIASPKSKTELFSPVSIAGALSLLLLGSAGNTREELINVLGFQGQPITFTDIHKSFGRLFRELVSNEPSLMTKIPWRENDKCNNPDYDDEEDYPSVQKPTQRAPTNQGSRGKRDTDSHYISVANGVFIDQNLPLNSYYEDLTKVLYAGEISRKPLLKDPVRSSNEINSWVNQATRSKIREIVTPEQVSNAPMVLASALYFKAKWETMFVEPDTRPRPFYVNGRDSPPVDVYTMATTGCFPFYEHKELDVKIVGLPYQEGRTTMYIVMPNQSDRQKLQLFQRRVHVSQLDEFINRMVVRTGTILLPKMKLENTFGLKDILISQGLQTAFSPYLSNLTEITKNHRIFEIGNEPGQSRPTPSSMPTTWEQPSAKPTPQQTNTQGLNNFNQRVPSQAPGNSSLFQTPPSIQPNRTPDVSSASKPTYCDELNELECTLTNKCIFKGNRCNYNPNTQVLTDDRGCSLKPWNIDFYCPPEKKLHKQALCLADSHYKYEVGTGQCTQNCVQVRRWCYCCKLSAVVPTQQGTISSLSTDHQPSSNPSGAFEVSNRFDHNYNPSTTPVGCQIYDTQTGRCKPSIVCPLVNQNTAPFYGNSGCQQTQSNVSPPPNLYNGGVQHNVPAQQGTISYSSTLPQQNSNPHTPVEVAHPSIKNYNPYPPQTLCITYLCNNHGCTATYTDCSQVNQNAAPLPGKSRRRTKRQAQSNASPPPNLYVGDVLHKVTLDINEQGTEGGAVTAVVIDRISSAFNMKVNGPFLIYLRNDLTKLPLFYGAVFDPRP